jgi:hypothetical protein
MYLCMKEAIKTGLKKGSDFQQIIMSVYLYMCICTQCLSLKKEASCIDRFKTIGGQVSLIYTTMVGSIYYYGRLELQIGVVVKAVIVMVS